MRRSFIRNAPAGWRDSPHPDSQLEAERVALLAEEQSLMAEHDALHLRPDDRPAHTAHRARLQAQQVRIRAYTAALRTTPQVGVCPACLATNIASTPTGESLRCLACGAGWTLGSGADKPSA